MRIAKKVTPSTNIQIYHIFNCLICQRFSPIEVRRDKATIKIAFILLRVYNSFEKGKKIMSEGYIEYMGKVASYFDTGFKDRQT